MSSRQAASQSTEVAGEAVWCHVCRREWNSDEHEAASCPHCGSDFTEIIEAQNDPRLESLMADELFLGAGTRNNPVELDSTTSPLRRSDQHGSGSRYFVSQTTTGPDGTRTVRTSSNFAGGPPPWDGSGNVMDPISSLMSSLFNGRTAMQSNDERGDYGPGGMHFGFSYTRGDGQPASSFHFGNPQRTEPGLQPRDANSPQAGTPNVEHISGYLQDMFGPHRAAHEQAHQQAHAQHGMPFPPMPPHSPFAALFNSLFNPANAAHGDAVYTQEALDRVITQLMEQTQGSTAPPPAPEEAINALPTKKVDKGMLGENGEAECSVCMDSVEVGDEVVSLPCKHWFHRNCVSLWLQEHNTCPICRKGITPDSQTQRQPPSTGASGSSGNMPSTSNPGRGWPSFFSGPAASNHNNTNSDTSTYNNNLSNYPSFVLAPEIFPMNPHANVSTRRTPNGTITVVRASPNALQASQTRVLRPSSIFPPPSPYPHTRNPLPPRATGNSSPRTRSRSHSDGSEVPDSRRRRVENGDAPTRSRSSRPRVQQPRVEQGQGSSQPGQSGSNDSTTSGGGIKGAIKSLFGRN